MGRLFVEYLDAKQMYCCKKCHTHLVDRKNLIARVSNPCFGEATALEREHLN